MPWCEDCSKYWAPSAMRPDGSCPTCGRVLDEPQIQSTVTAKNLDLKGLAATDADDDASAPWHFKLLVVALVIYLAWRVIEIFI